MIYSLIKLNAFEHINPATVEFSLQRFKQLQQEFYLTS